MIVITSALNDYKLKVGVILILLVLEVGISLLFPLFIGFAIDDAIKGLHAGTIQLGCLGITALVIGLGRRISDSRFYAMLYQDLGLKTISNIPEERTSLKSARLDMIKEIIEFLENTFPELISNVIGLMGVIIIIATLNLQVFYFGIFVGVIIFLIYWKSSKKTIALNEASNNEFENQVSVILDNNKDRLQHHLSEMMKWNIKLSDLEAINYSLSWILMILFLLTSIIISIDHGIIQYGALFALIMYVFQFIESMVNLPLYYQNWLRLKEIGQRLNQV